MYKNRVYFYGFLIYVYIVYVLCLRRICADSQYWTSKQIHLI